MKPTIEKSRIQKISHHMAWIREAIFSITFGIQAFQNTIGRSIPVIFKICCLTFYTVAVIRNHFEDQADHTLKYHQSTTDSIHLLKLLITPSFTQQVETLSNLIHYERNIPNEGEVLFICLTLKYFRNSWDSIMHYQYPMLSLKHHQASVSLQQLQYTANRARNIECFLSKHPF